MIEVHGAGIQVDVQTPIYGVLPNARMKVGARDVTEVELAPEDLGDLDRPAVEIVVPGVRLDRDRVEFVRFT